MSRTTPPSETEDRGRYEDYLGPVLTAQAEFEPAELAERTTEPCHLIAVAGRVPTANLKKYLRQQSAHQASLEVNRVQNLSTEIINTAGHRPRTLSPVGRGELINEALGQDLEETGDWLRDLRVTTGSKPTASQIDLLDEALTELDVLTGYHPDRLFALGSIIETLAPPADDQSAELVRGVLGLAAEIREKTSASISPEAQHRKAARLLRAQGQPLWERCYAPIEQVTLTGFSTLSASIVDLLRVIVAVSDVDIELVVRTGTGPRIKNRLQEAKMAAPPGQEVLTR